MGHNSTAHSLKTIPPSLDSWILSLSHDRSASISTILFPTKPRERAKHFPARVSGSTEAGDTTTHRPNSHPTLPPIPIQILPPSSTGPPSALHSIQTPWVLHANYRAQVSSFGLVWHDIWAQGLRLVHALTSQPERPQHIYARGEQPQTEWRQGNQAEP